MCSLAPESISQWLVWTFKEQDITVFIPEVEEVMEEIMWFVLAELGLDAWGTKDDCWSKETRWPYCSWVKPV